MNEKKDFLMYKANYSGKIIEKIKVSIETLFQEFDELHAVVSTACFTFQHTLDLLSYLIPKIERGQIMFAPKEGSEIEDVKEFCKHWSFKCPELQFYSLCDDYYKTVFMLVNNKQLKSIIILNDGLIIEDDESLSRYFREIEIELSTKSKLLTDYYAGGLSFY